MADAASSKKKSKKTDTAVAAVEPTASPAATTQGAKTLAVDIGGSGVKTMLLDANGKALTDRLRAKTPAQPTPKAISAIIADFATQLGTFDRVSVGFPGVIKQGVVYTAANLDQKWVKYPFAENLSSSWASRCAWPTML